MQPIQMVDLVNQYKAIAPEIQQRHARIFESAAFINGPEVKEFQAALEQYLGAKHVVPCANGTDALQVAMMAQDYQPGDEAIVPTFTYISTVEVIALLGLKPVMVDVDPETFNISPAGLAEKLTERTRAIVPVHLFGQAAHMEPLLRFAAEHKLDVLEDTAQAIGADYIFEDGSRKKLGTLGTIGATSFYPSKNLGCYGDGGALFTNSDDIAEKLRMTANHGQNRRYYFDRVGVNSRLDALQAAVLNAKLPHLDAYNARRRAAADFYDQAFADVGELITPVRAPYSTHVFHQYTVRVQGGQRDALQEHLNQQNIPNVIFYPLSAHQQSAYQRYGYAEGDFPVAEQLGREVLSLPMHSELQEDQLDYITRSVRSFFGK